MNQYGTHLSREELRRLCADMPMELRQPGQTVDVKEKISRSEFVITMLSKLDRIDPEVMRGLLNQLAVL